MEVDGLFNTAAATAMDISLACNSLACLLRSPSGQQQAWSKQTLLQVQRLQART